MTKLGNHRKRTDLTQDDAAATPGAICTAPSSEKSPEGALILASLYGDAVSSSKCNTQSLGIGVS